MSEPYERTVYEAQLDIDYEARLQQLHARLYGRLHNATLLIIFIATSTAFASVLDSAGTATAIWSGLVITVVGYADVLLDFAGRRAQHEIQRGRYLELRARSIGMALEEIDKCRYTTAKTDPPEIEALRNPAFNDNLRAHGRHDHQVSLTWLEKLVAAIA